MGEKKKSGFATTGFVLGIVAIVGSWIPILNVLSIILAILAVIFSAIPLFQKRSLGKAITGLVLGILTIIIAISINNAVVNNVDKTLNSEVTSVKNARTGQITYSIGEIITAKDFEITVESVGTAAKLGGQYFNSLPSEGGIYVTLDVSYKNISDKPKGMFSTPSFYLIDPKGVKYSADISASSYYAREKEPDRKILSDLNPGIKVNDNKVFEVSMEFYGDGEGWQISARADKDYRVNIKDAAEMAVLELVE